MRILLVLCGIAVGFLLFEFGLRIIEPASDAQILNDVMTPSGPYLSLIPASSGVMLGRKVTVNALGYRGAQRPEQKPAGVKRLEFFGDSHTFSMGADDDATYPNVVEKLLNAGTQRYEALNFGVPGQDLRQLLTHARNHAFRFDPDVIVLTFHQGDILESPDGPPAASTGPGDQQIGALYRVKRDLLKYSFVARLVVPYGAEFAQRLFGWSPGVTVAEVKEIRSDGPRWRKLQQDVLAFKHDADARNIKTVLVLFPSMQPFDRHPAAEEYRELKEWFDAHGIPALNLLPSFAGRDASALAASILDKHPNEQAYQIAGQAVAGFLGELLAPDGTKHPAADSGASATTH
jgi:hypothetical protein